MAFEEDLNPGWLYELPFYIAATFAYGALFTLNPMVRWGSRERAPDLSVPIEFVAALPAPSPNLAPAPGGDARVQRPPRKGPGAYAPAKIKAVAKKPPRAQLRPKAKRTAGAAQMAAARLQKLERIKAAREAAAARAKERAEQARQARLAAARKKAEISQQLAAMADPDETLGQKAGSPDGGRALAGARKVAAAAALADANEPADAGDGGADLIDTPAKGGGTGPDGSGAAYTLDGPVGSRRVLERRVPTSPDWVGARGLDLKVIVRFQVLPDGSVKPGAVIQKTSGFPEIDRLALDALRRWRFESIPPNGAEVWGRVAFRFTS